MKLCNPVLNWYDYGVKFYGLALVFGFNHTSLSIPLHLPPSF